MKIQTHGPQTTRPVRRDARRVGGGTFHVAEAPPPAASPARLTGLTGPSAAAAVLLAQEEDTPRSRQRRSMDRAEDLLDRLDELRLSILSGGIAVSKLEALRRSLSVRLQDTGNPKLQETLDEIDLRVAVELAKYSS